MVTEEDFRIWFAFYYCSFPKEHHNLTGRSSSSSFLTSVSLRFIYFSLSVKNMTSSTPPKCLISNPLVSSSSNTEHGIPKWFMHMKQVYFVLSKQEKHISSSSSRHFVPKDQNKLCTHDKNRKRVELWVKINVFNVFVMYALDSAHVKVPRLNRSRSFAVLFDKPGRMERQVDPNTNLPNLIDSNVELYMCRT